MTDILKYIDERLEQLRKDKASPLIVGDGERELKLLKENLLNCLSNLVLEYRDFNQSKMLADDIIKLHRPDKQP